MNPPSAFRHLDVSSTDAGTVVTLIDCPLLDEQHTLIVREQLLRFLEGVGGCRLFLNLGNVDRLISTTLSMLLTINNTLRAAGGHLVVCNARAPIDEVLQITRLDLVLDIQPGPPPGMDQKGQGEPVPLEDGPKGSGPATGPQAG
jgi:anti-anti-sigma factor